MRTTGMTGVAARTLSWLLVVLVCPSAGASVRVEAFAPNLPGSDLDDAIWLYATEDTDLRDVVLADNQGRLGFPPGAVIGAGNSVVVAGNATAFKEASDVWPDFAIKGLSPERTVRVLRAGFALSQEGDRIELTSSSTRRDVVVYGTGTPSGSGWDGPPLDVRGGTFLRLFPRGGGGEASGAAAWESPRRHFVGQRDWPPERFAVSGEVVAFLAPEQARSMVELAVGLAKHHLRLNVYEFRDLPLAQAIAAHAGATPGLRMEVLLDAAPVGETRQEGSDSAHVRDTLVGAGAEVRLFEHGRYGYNHAKYAVIDDRFVLVQSENLVPSGVPADHAAGNRGWGVLLDDPALATRLAAVFEDDFRLRDHGARSPRRDEAPAYPPPVLARFESSRVSSPFVAAAGVNATLLVAPLRPGDGDPVLDLLDRATNSIRVEQLNFPPAWRDHVGRSWPHPYLEAMERASRRGVRVQALLDGHFVDEGPDNDETVAAISSWPDAQARLGSPARPVLHVKGLVVDDRWVLVGSMNWNLHSMVQNREVGVLLEDPGLARFFAAAFDADWAAEDRTATTASVGPLATLLILGLLVREAQGRKRT